MNNTKWEELRLAMLNLGNRRPRWRTKDLSGYVTSWDGEWHYHFRDGGYESIEWVEIESTTPEQDSTLLELLRKIHLPGNKIDNGYRIWGYVSDGSAINYL